jgi:DegT/DnrJ/EryC1/StrS aminotransferase family
VSSVAGPSITQKEIDYVAEATAGAWYEDAGRFNARFERSFADYVGARHAISLPSCTSAIHLSLVALGIGAIDNSRLYQTSVQDVAARKQAEERLQEQPDAGGARRGAGAAARREHSETEGR